MTAKIGSKLAELRKEHSFSQEALASELNISRQAISKWERGEASPDTDNLIALALLYKVSLDELVGFSLPKAEEPEASAESEIEEEPEPAVPVEEPVTEAEYEADSDADIAVEAPTEQGFYIENEEFAVRIQNGVLTVTPKPKKKKSFLSRLFGKLCK